MPSWSRTTPPDSSPGKRVLLPLVCACLALQASVFTLEGAPQIDARPTLAASPETRVHSTSIVAPAPDRRVPVPVSAPSPGVAPAAVVTEATPAEVLRRYCEELDRASAARLARGEYATYGVGDPESSSPDDETIRAVRAAGNDRYRLVVFDRATEPELYRLRDEVNRLRGDPSSRSADPEDDRPAKS